EQVTDIWTFGRDAGSRDPNWALIATSAPNRRSLRAATASRCRRRTPLSPRLRRHAADRLPAEPLFRPARLQPGPHFRSPAGARPLLRPAAGAPRRPAAGQPVALRYARRLEGFLHRPDRAAARRRGRPAPPDRERDG